MVLSLKGLEIKLLDEGWKNVSTICWLERFSIECGKTKTKQNAYQLE